MKIFCKKDTKGHQKKDTKGHQKKETKGNRVLSCSPVFMGGSQFLKPQKTTILKLPKTAKFMYK